MDDRTEPVIRARTPAEREERRRRQLAEEQAVVEGILWGMLPVVGEFMADDVWIELQRNQVQLRRHMAVSLAIRKFAALGLIEPTGDRPFITDWRGHGRKLAMYTTLGRHRVSEELCRWQKAVALAEWFGEEAA